MRTRWMTGLLLGAATTAGMLAAGTGTAIDRAFVAKVSQGGMYEVEAGKVAEQRAQAQDVKDLAVMEVHDHTLVGEGLRRASDAAGVSFPESLSGEFQARLDRLKSVSAGKFDVAYIADMKLIHDKDEKLFAQEAMDGSAGFKPFAHERDLIVKRHIGALHGADEK